MQKRITAFFLGAAALLGIAALAQYGSDTPERDQWQRPAEVMDALKIQAGSVVADIGAGRGYFTFRLAERVGPTGKVYSEDIADEVIRDIRQRATQQKLKQIEVVQGSERDPRLPAGTLDAVLIVDSYHEFREYAAMLKGVHAALKPGGLLGIIDKEAEAGLPRSEYHESHTIPVDLAIDDVTRNGFRLLRRERGFTSSRDQKWWFLIFEKPPLPPTR
jgi:predicted methyltransferase